MTEFEIHTFITLSCCWLPCVFSPSAWAMLGLRLPSSRIQNTRLRPSSLQGPATASRLQARHPTPSGSSRTLISPFPPAGPQHTRVACLPQGTRPQDIGVPDPLSRALKLIARAGRCSLALQQLLSSPASPSYPARRLASYYYYY